MGNIRSTAQPGNSIAPCQPNQRCQPRFSGSLAAHRGKSLSSLPCSQRISGVTQRVATAAKAVCRINRVAAGGTVTGRIIRHETRTAPLAALIPIPSSVIMRWLPRACRSPAPLSSWNWPGWQPQGWAEQPEPQDNKLRDCALKAENYFRPDTSTARTRLPAPEGRKPD